MSNNDIARIIEQYAEERRHEPLEVAQRHFLTHAHLICTRSEIDAFMKRTRNLLNYYIDSLSLFENPFRNSQVCWLLFMLLIFGFGIYLATDDDLRLAGIALCTSTSICGASLWKIIWAKWLDTDLLIASYREMIELIDSQLAT